MLQDGDAQESVGCAYNLPDYVDCCTLPFLDAKHMLQMAVVLCNRSVLSFWATALFAGWLMLFLFCSYVGLPWAALNDPGMLHLGNNVKHM